MRRSSPCSPRSCSPRSVVAAPAAPRRCERRPRPQGRRSSSGRRTDVTAELSRRCRQRLRRGDQVHVQRGQGLQPERDVVQGQGGGRWRVDRHLLRPRQRLAEPVHLRPEVHDQGWLRAQLRPQRRRQAVRLREQVLRRAVRSRRSTSPRTRSSCCSHLCYASGNSRAGQGRAIASRVARQRVDNYAAGFLKARAPRRSSPTDIVARADYIRALFTTEADDRQLWRNAPGLPRPRELLRLDPDERCPCPDGSRGHVERLLSVARDPANADHQHGRRDGRHEPRSRHVAGTRPGVSPRGRCAAGASIDTAVAGAPEAASHRSITLRRHRPSDEQARPGSVSSRSRDSTTPPSTGSCGRST